jgi:hypothetical protein
MNATALVALVCIVASGLCDVNVPPQYHSLVQELPLDFKVKSLPHSNENDSQKRPYAVSKRLHRWCGRGIFFVL